MRPHELPVGRLDHDVARDDCERLGKWSVPQPCERLRVLCERLRERRYALLGYLHLKREHLGSIDEEGDPSSRLFGRITELTSQIIAPGELSLSSLPPMSFR